MKIVAIEPTPNPNSMKLTMNESLPEGQKWHVTRGASGYCPEHIRALLAVDGVKSVYQVADFIALERNPRADWRAILAEARRLLSGEGLSRQARSVLEGDQAFGAVHVYVQLFRGLPMQIKLVTDQAEVRVALPERFKRAAMRAVEGAGDLLAERRWVEKGVRYGELAAVGDEVAQQVSAGYDEKRLNALLTQALSQERPGPGADDEPLPPAVVAQQMLEADWRLRYAALDRLDPTEQSLLIIRGALTDAHPSVRRLATAYLGAVGGEQVIPDLIATLQDPNVSVRRAAGDSLSDLGDPAAIGAMTEGLRDSSRLVRWRAARYLYEVGDQSALPALRSATEDPEFEVSLQVQMAIERIEGGKEATGPAWQQMTRLMSDPKA